MRKELLSNHNEIQVTDFGAGSKVLNENKRSVADIAAKAGISSKRGKLLAKTVAYFKPQTILEIGTSLGISTAYMVSGAPDAKITTLEGCPEIAGIARDNFQIFDFKQINLIVGKFEDTLPPALADQQFDLIYFDGNHQAVPTISYFEQCLKTVHEHSLFIFDDIHWTADMDKAWKHIRNHKKVSLSVDTYQWGLVFFKTGKAKEHFTLRI
ncbi:O-methyltransferase [Lutimonas vermicola]|uniref:Class I SAM-dependent methyltransferase n=1 Tax=Lutimonas vermicola TaxID=414288 RepID=A0ABU9KYC1_9FLAO